MHTWREGMKNGVKDKSGRGLTCSVEVVISTEGASREKSLEPGVSKH